VDLLKAVWRRFSERRGTTLAAAIGYRAIFALAPMLVVVVSGAGMIFGAQASQGLLAADLVRLLGPELAGTIEDLIAAAAGQGGVGIIGTVLLLWAGSGLFNELQGGLGAIYDSDRVGGIRKAVGKRLVTIAAVIALAGGFSLLVALAAWIPMSGSILATVATGALVLASVAVGFRYLTLHRPPWALTLRVAFGTVIAMAAASIGVGLFVTRGGGGTATGLAGSATAVLLLIYVLSAVFLLGGAALAELEVRAAPAPSRLTTGAL
jgi:membrane protein